LNSAVEAYLAKCLKAANASKDMAFAEMQLCIKEGTVTKAHVDLVQAADVAIEDLKRIKITLEVYANLP
tara:strand:+ start:546 stop:752 length:207 start_codon:yes stop_codon:yes gene_type:complete